MPQPFNPNKLPSKVRGAFNMGALGWMYAVQCAKEVGLTKIDFLADMVFHMHHPERKGRPISPGENEMVKQWKAFRTLIKPMIDYKGSSSTSTSSKPTPAAGPGSAGGGSGSSSSPELIDLLLDIDTKSLGRTAGQRSRLLRLQAFLMDALDGVRVDDRYYQFSYLDGFGREYNCKRQGTVISVKRETRPQHAVDNFKRWCATATTTRQAANALAQLHDTVLCHLDVLLRWAHHNSAIGDAPIRDYTECSWLLEVRSASKRTKPQSVYSAYKWLLESVRGPCT